MTGIGITGAAAGRAVAPPRQPADDRGQRVPAQLPPGTPAAQGTAEAGPDPAGAREAWRALPPVEAFVLHARDSASLSAMAERLADMAPSLSDAELRDLACQLGSGTCPPGGLRLGIVAGEQRELAVLARSAACLITSVQPGRVIAAPGIFAGNAARGRVVYLFPGLGAGQDAAEAACSPLFSLTDPQAVQPAILHASLTGLRWLDRLGVSATAAVGHSLGEITGLVWAGCLQENEATRLVAQRSAVISASGARQTAMLGVAADEAACRSLCAGVGLVIAAYNGPQSHVLAGPAAAVREAARRAREQGIRAAVLGVSHAFHSPAMAGCAAPLRSVLADIRFAPPARRLVSTVTGREVAAGDDIAALLCAGLTSPVRFAKALGAAAADADLLCETGPGHALAALAAAGCQVPAVSLQARTAEDRGAAQAAAALFVAGAVHSLKPALAGRTARPLDIWQERITMSPARPAGHARNAAPAAEPAPLGEAGDAAAAPAGPAIRGRFLQDIRLYRAGAELIADSLLGPGTDPYLADYLIDGAPALPPVMALEAMAQAAAGVAGRQLPRAETVCFYAHAFIRPDTMIRVCARQEAAGVTALLRSRTDGQWTDHCRATFRPCPVQGAPGPRAARGGGDPAVTAAGWPMTETAAGILDSSELYGSVCFQTGRFRRVAFLPELTSRRCRALVRGGDELAWFGASLPAGDAPFQLGSPGLNDATLHVLQACFPSRRMVPAGCDSVTASGQQVPGAVEVIAVQRPARGPAEHVWDITGRDAAGQVVISWAGLRLRDAGPVPGDLALPPALLGVYLERGATALGLDPALRVTVRCEPTACSPAAGRFSPAPAEAAVPYRRRGWVSARSRGQLDDLSLRLRATSPAACAWETADPEPDGGTQDAELAGAEFRALGQRLRDSLAEPGPAVQARIRTAIECLSKAGRQVGCELVVGGCYQDRWALLHAGDAMIACTCVRVTGVASPVAVSIMTGNGMHAVGAA